MQTGSIGVARWLGVTSLLIAVLTFAFALSGCTAQIDDAQLQRTYVGRDSCAQCHQQEADLFKGSHHDLAMDAATEEFVLGDFDNQTIEHFGVESRMYRDGKRFMVNTEGPDGEMHDYEIAYVFGVEPLQQYMVEIEPAGSVGANNTAIQDRPGFTPVSATLLPESRKALGRIQVLRISWDVVNQEWFYLMPPDVTSKIEPDDPLHWTGFTQCWNTSCAVCHSTDLHKKFDHETNMFATTFSEIDVSCEACHGPASLHVHMADRDVAFPHNEHGYGLASLKTESNLAQIESCAPCHSRRAETSDTYHAGSRFDNHFSCSLLTSGVYHNDGQIRDEDYVYGSFIQSKMFHNGIRCTDCHDPHSTILKFQGNQLCTSCHQHPAGKYDSPSHHHHAVGSTGASCVECHMPSTTYMKIDARRDHSFRIPRPDLSVKMKTPNACSACHLELLDKSEIVSDRKPAQYLDWIVAREQGDDVLGDALDLVDRQMADAFDEWYPEGSSSVPRTRYYEHLAMGRSETETSLEKLRELAVDGSAPGIMRATAIDDLAANGDLESFAIAVEALTDPDPKVVAAAVRLLEFNASHELDRIQYSESRSVSGLEPAVKRIASLLNHESRLVRIESAHAIVGIPGSVRSQMLTSIQKKSFDSALSELIESMLVNNDRATAHMTLGSIYDAMQQNDRAAESFRTAIKVDPDMTGPRSNLAAFLDSRQQTLSEQLAKLKPGTGSFESTQDLIARLATESNVLRTEDHELLRRDLQRAEGLPNTHGMHYRFAMSSYLQGDNESVETHLLKAVEQVPDSAMYLLGLATLYVQLERWDDADARVKRLLEIEPDNPGYLSLQREISANKK